MGWREPKRILLFYPPSVFYYVFFFPLPEQKTSQRYSIMESGKGSEWGWGAVCLFSRGNFPPSVRSWFHFFFPT